jgi:hypothetical protein
MTIDKFNKIVLQGNPIDDMTPLKSLKNITDSDF